MAAGAGVPAGAAGRAAPELLVLGVLAGLALLVHRIGPALTRPYWLDEAWVAMAGRVPVRDLPVVSASTPLGFTALVAALPAHGQLARLLPLAFLVGSVLAGYLLGRVLPWPGPAGARLAGLVAALAVLLLPAQLMRHDLKQYTADGALSLLLLVLLARAEPGAGRRRLTALGGTVVLGMLLSHVLVLVGVAVLGALVVTALPAHRRPELPARLRTAGLTGAGMAAVYLLVDRPGQTGALAGYWAGYLPAAGELPRYLPARLAQLTPALGLPWPVFLGLAGLGVLALATLDRPATALAAAGLPVLAVLAGVAGRYPLLDQRTSHYLLVTGAALAGLGVARLAGWLTGAGCRADRTRARWAGLIALCLLAVGGYAVANQRILRDPPVPGSAGEDIRAQVTYLAAHRRPGEVVLVNLSGQYGFGYYWTADRARPVRGGVPATGWTLSYPPASRIVLAADRTPAAVAAALAQARALAGPDGRIWLVRSHVIAAEAAAWRDALAGAATTAVPTGPEPLVLIS